MGREIKRVPLDFDAPADQTWEGYLMPDRLCEDDCPDCKHGLSPQAEVMHDQWYGYAPFRPEDNGSTPLTPQHPAVRAFAERNVTHAPEYYGKGESAIHREALRLTALWNGMWLHHLNQQDVAAFLATERGIHELTHEFVPGEGWRLIEPAVIPTPADVQSWLIATPLANLNAYTAIEARCQREGVPYLCATCAGHGSIEAYPGQRAEAEAWERSEPPTGDGWQLWQTVSDAPMSPVFPTAEDLIDWMTTPAAKWGAMGPWSRDTAEAFVRGSGWAPTFVGGSGGLVDGVTAVTS